MPFVRLNTITSQAVSDYLLLSSVSGTSCKKIDASLKNNGVPNRHFSIFSSSYKTNHKFSIIRTVFGFLISHDDGGVLNKKQYEFVLRLIITVLSSCVRLTDFWNAFLERVIFLLLKLSLYPVSPKKVQQIQQSASYE